MRNKPKTIANFSLSYSDLGLVHGEELESGREISTRHWGWIMCITQRQNTNAFIHVKLLQNEGLLEK